MSQTDLFVAKLDEALLAKAAVLTKEEIPKLKEQCRTFQAAFSGLYKVFLEKGLIQEDQYDYEQKVSDLKAPPSDPFSESDLQNQMNIRLQTYTTQLDFMNNFFFMSVESLNLKGIKNMLSIIDYFHWSELSPNAAHMMTRSLTIYVEKIKQTGDGMAINILSNSIKVLKDLQKTIKVILKKITLFARQNYKLQCRMNVISQMTLDPNRINNDLSGTLQAIKFEFPVKWEDNPFFRELVEEILNEDYSPQAESIQEKILTSLAVKEKIVQKKKIDKSAELKKELLVLVGELAKIYIPMETIIIRLDDNSHILDDNMKTFAQKFSLWINRVMRHKNEIFYELEMSSSSNRKSREKINFTSYLNWIRMKANFYKNLNNPQSTSYLRAAESDLPQLEEFLEKNQLELKKIINRLAALERFFKDDADPELKNKVKGFKAELQQMKMVVGKIVSGLKEYQVQLEEIEQLKALGIDPES
ncbi:MULTISPECIES: hypothetical protein [unclassified Oceanispirochaeta]|uniref:hypothetical protein n=1 Tax=unclassified Oceanispirochaeta TaxID=2635722 RepID=UPI000E09A55D|nr:MULTISPECIES: hypothetical protein [unclassified Oceanispirochaeta]MBF9015518.1 hypothetical protein [Oceanispirochaeta sp. M2]NPD71977.1 hypothetical protein [Oceanispirochaeta sp. M1]RDG32783.1 hypothetical protein DV872_07685 [Oceanispirochaeta sp. M1]